MFDFVGQQGFVEFPCQRSFVGEVEVARYLLGNRAGAGLYAAGSEVANDGAADADNVYAPVVVEAFVFRGNNRVFQHLGEVFDFGKGAPFLTIRADQLAV